jgi:hypothetical protein
MLFFATWTLWTSQTEFPQVPLFGWARSLPGFVDWLAFGVVLGSLIVAIVQPSSRRCWGALAVALSVLFLLDQHRLQPWAWQLFLMAAAILRSQASDGSQPNGTRSVNGMALAAGDLPENVEIASPVASAIPLNVSEIGRHLPARLLRGLTISIYFWSAVSKFDAGFFASHGQTLVEALFHSIGITAAGWPARVKWWLAFALPLGELLVAVGFCWPRTRRATLFAATALHVGLILALGPLGLGHRPGVLLWNIAFIGHDWLLFRSQASGAASALRPGDDDIGGLTPPRSPARFLILFACVWPITERWGLCDHWLAWSVYSTRIERVSVTLTDEGVRRLPESARRLAVDGELWLDHWSLAALDVPIYPQLRFQFGVIEGLRHRCGADHLVEINVQHSPRDSNAIERLTVEQFEQRRRAFAINTRARQPQ